MFSEILHIIGIAGIVCLWEYTLRYGQINQWIANLLIGKTVCEQEYDAVLSAKIEQNKWIKLLGFCPICLGFWITLILVIIGVLNWYAIGINYLTIKIILRCDW